MNQLQILINISNNKMCSATIIIKRAYINKNSYRKNYLYFHSQSINNKELDI